MIHKEATLSSSDAAREAGISLRQLYYWERIGILTPGKEASRSREFRRYTRDDIVLLRKVRGLIDESFTLKSAVGRVQVTGEDVE